nr:TetR family transcriptional regulator C-terminal domain-containing protein [Amycolatopsis granulosa]
MGGTADPDAIADAAVDVVAHWISASRERMLARYELMLEASRRPELQAVFTAARDHYRALAADTLRALGAIDPEGQAQLFIACLDGLVFRHLTGADPLTASRGEQRRAMRDLLRGFTRPAADDPAG